MSSKLAKIIVGLTLVGILFKAHINADFRKELTPCPVLTWKPGNPTLIFASYESNIYLIYIEKGKNGLNTHLTSAHEDQGRNGISQREVLQKVR